MSLFDDLVEEALRERPEAAPLRPVVEKELLHHEILRIMNAAGLLGELVLIGGTCLRLCHGSPRLSEDLDFATGLSPDAVRSHLTALDSTLVQKLVEKFDLPVTVEAPVRSDEQVHTWRVRITTRPGRRDLPLQRVNIDVQTIPAFASEPSVLRNPYGIELGTMGLIIAAERLGEILADKVVAVALRPNRVKNRDLWDISWLEQKGIGLETKLVTAKLAARGVEVESFRERYSERCAQLAAGHDAFVFEMRRFLPPGPMREAIESDAYWSYLMRTVRSLVPVGQR